MPSSTASRSREPALHTFAALAPPTIGGQWAQPNVAWSLPVANTSYTSALSVLDSAIT